MLAAKEAQALCALEHASTPVHGCESGVGSRFWVRGRCLHAGVPALEVDTSFASRRVTRVLDQTMGKRGKPLIRCDNSRLDN